MKQINGNILIYKIASAYNIKAATAGSSTNKQFPVKNVIIKISSVKKSGQMTTTKTSFSFKYINS